MQRASDPCLGVPAGRPVSARQVLEAAVLDQLETVRREGEEREKEQHERHPALGCPHYLVTASLSLYSTSWKSQHNSVIEYNKERSFKFI